MDERIKQICRCMDELARIRTVIRNGEWRKLGSSLMDAQVGELDWLSELHYWIHQ
jgi:hypothetical protein